MFCLPRCPLKVLEGERPVRSGGHLGDHAVCDHCHLILTAQYEIGERKVLSFEQGHQSYFLCGISGQLKSSVDMPAQNVPERRAHKAVE